MSSPSFSTDYLILTFSRILRHNSSDTLITHTGVTGYVHAVLLPEMVVALVMDDMNVDAEGARVIMNESAEIGALLCEELDESVQVGGEDEEEGEDV